MTEAGTFKVVVRVERRSDGGLRVWSDDIPGLVLSNRDPHKVMADIVPAIEAILSEALGCKVEASQLERFRAPSASATPSRSRRPDRALHTRRKTLEYAALACA